MTVEYELKQADFLFLSKQRRRFGSQFLPRLYYYGILPALAVALGLATDSFVIGTGFTVLFVASGWGFQHLFEKNYYRSAYSEENLSFAARRWKATLAEDGMHISSDAAEIMYRWPYVRNVYRDAGYVCFVLSPIQRTHIPVRAFADEEHLQEFISKAQSYINLKPAAKLC
jgi:hypothetical protein